MGLKNKDQVEDIMNEVGVKSVFSQNSKMAKSSKNGIHLYNFGIPAFMSKNGTKTCPNARQCVAGCYARAGAYTFRNVAKAFEARLSLTRTKGFEMVIEYHIEKLLIRHPTGRLYLRIHDSGDFYSPEYQLAWYSIANKYRQDRVQFYAYTKMVSQSETLKSELPDNFRLIYSLGGSEDNIIDRTNMRHSRVFESETELTESGYVDASNDDMLALTPNPKIGLVYHGRKDYTNTTWNKVKA